ncbi:hypothetical protein [Azonexus sp.]|jgi:hypothetical protein|uniref:hypothetical protein n=1 Tax=Azonexus sp. TaxID=1872668 RepID=UPI002820C14C|nr:hypothetical protein [Azonexus sp.]MDR1995020.1 hypothetical protein [Azonexus sp.]
MRRLPFFALVALPSLLAVPPVQAQSSATGSLAVVVNARCGIAVLTRNEIINIFFGRYRLFFNGREAQPADLEDSHPMRSQFYRRLVGKDISEINAYWSRQIFSGRMQALPKVTTPEEMTKWVVTNPCGIGFVEQAKVDARFNIVYELAP